MFFWIARAGGKRFAIRSAEPSEAAFGSAGQEKCLEIYFQVFQMLKWFSPWKP
jgi:hypothetical protein